MGPVPQPPQSPPRSRGRGGRAVGDLPVEGRGAARAVGLERRGEGAPGRGAVGRAAVPGASGGCLQCGPGRVRAPQAPEERRQVPRRALQGQQQEVPRARQERRPPQPQQHRNPRHLPRKLLTQPHPHTLVVVSPLSHGSGRPWHLPRDLPSPQFSALPSLPSRSAEALIILCSSCAHPVHVESSSTDSSPVGLERSKYASKP